MSSLLRERRNLIGKDVIRTEPTRLTEPEIKRLQELLTTYCIFDQDLGYVQGLLFLIFQPLRNALEKWYKKKVQFSWPYSHKRLVLDQYMIASDPVYSEIKPYITFLNTSVYQNESSFWI